MINLFSTELENSFFDTKQIGKPGMDYLKLEKINHGELNCKIEFKVLCVNCYSSESLMVGHLSQYKDKERYFFRDAVEYIKEKWENTHVRPFYRVCEKHESLEDYYVVVCQPETFEEVMYSDFVSELDGRVCFGCECNLSNWDLDNGFMIEMVESLKYYCDCHLDMED